MKTFILYTYDEYGIEDDGYLITNDINDIYRELKKLNRIDEYNKLKNEIGETEGHHSLSNGWGGWKIIIK